MSKPTSPRLISGSTFQVEALEPRLLLSATALPEPDPLAPALDATSILALATLDSAAASLPDARAEIFGDSPQLVLDSSTVQNYAGQDSVVYGSSDLLTQVTIGDGTSTAVNLPGQTALIQGDWVAVSSPLLAANLIITGDGTTVKLNNTITSVTNIINDAIEVSGSFSSSPVRSITSTGGVLTINGTLNGDNHAGALAPVNQNGGADDVILNATGAIFIRDAVGGIAGNGLNHVSINTLGGTVGNVTFNDTVNLDGNLYIKKGLNVSFLRNVVVAGDLVIEDASDVRFEGTLTIGGSLRIIKASNVTFSGNVQVTGNVTIGRPDLLSSVGSVAFTSSARLDFGGVGAIFSSGSIAFGNNVGQSALSTLRPDSLTLASGATITFSSSASLLLDSTTPFVITQATDVSFGANITSGNFTVGRTGLVSGNLNFTGASIAVESFDLTTSGALGRVTIANNVLVGGGDATITANEINFGPSSTLGSSGGYASTLTLKPFDVARIIGIGTSPAGVPADINQRLDINSDDIKAILPSFSSVIFGDLYAGTGAVFVGAVGSVHSVSQFLTRTTIAGGSITLTQNLDVSTSADYLRLVARTGNITVNGVVNRGSATGSDLANESFIERNAWVRLEAANDIVVNRAIYAATRISLSAGTDGGGSIVVNSTGTNSGSLQTISTASGAQRVELIAGATSGNITLTDEVAAATITAAGTSSSVVLRAAAGGITQTDGLITADSLAVWARDSVALRTNVNQIGSQTINGAVLPGGTGAAITANMLGAVSAAFITNGGSGYTSAPTVTLGAPPAGGTQATATATVVGGFVTGITITNPGAGYLTAPTVSFSGGGGTGAAAISAVTPGSVASLTINAPGANFSAAPTVTIVGDGRTVATGSATITGGIGSYLVTSGGSSYTTLGLTLAGNSSANPTFNTIAGQLTVAAVGATGSGYATAPAVTVTGNGSGAAVTANLAANLSTASRTAGSGYTYTPAVYVTGGAASQIVNGLQITGDGSVSIVNSGAITVANATVTPNSASTRGSFSLTTLAGNLTVGYINTSSGSITLTSAAAILDLTSGSDTVPNLVTTGLVSLSAVTGIGAVGDADLDLTAGSIQATNTTSGDIVLHHQGLAGITVAGTGLVTGGGDGNINLLSAALNSSTGTLTVSAPVTAHGTGYIRLQAAGAQSDVVLATAAADLATTTGHISVLAERDLTTAAGTRLSTGTSGSIYLGASTGVLTMADDSLAVTDGGSIRASAPLNITVGGLHAGTGSVSVVSGASILDAGDTHKDISAAAVRLQAVGSVGVATNALEIASATLSASAGSAGISLREDDDVSVTAVTVGTKLIALNGSNSTVNDLAQSDLATTGNGSVALVTTAGSITLIDGDANNRAVFAFGTGVIHLAAGGATGSIVAQSDVVSGSGSISLSAGDGISFTAGSDVTTVGGSVDLTATLGSISQTNTATVSTSGGSIRANAGTDVTVASFNAAAGNVSVLAGRSILDGGDSAVDIVGTAARLVAGTAAGADSNALETTVATLAASAGSGGINISETNALVIDSVTVSVTRIGADFTSSTVTDAALADLVTTADGPVKVVTGGNLSLNKGDADDFAIDAAGAGTISLQATGDILMADGTIARTGTGSITFVASANIALSIVTSTSGDASLTATSGGISDVLTGEASNVSTTGLAAFDASTGVGNLGAADIDTEVGSVTARNRVSGNIVIDEATGVTVATAGLVNNVAAGHIILTAAAGSIAVDGPVTATGAGRILLSASGATSDISASKAVSTGVNGHVTVLAARSVSLTTGASVATLGTGTLDIEATAGSIGFADNVAATTAGGNIRLLAANDVTLTGLSAGAGSVTVQATAGSIIDAGETRTDIVAGSARLTAAIGIGSAASLETTVSNLAATATTGGIRVANTSSLSVTSVAALTVKRVAVDATLSDVGDAAALTDVSATTGLVELSSGGTLTLTDGTDADSRAVETTTGEIQLTAANNIVFEASVFSASGAITADSTSGALVDNTVSESALVVTTGLATLNAATGVGTGGAGDIDTTVATLRGDLSLSGGFFVEETDTLTVHADGIVTRAGNAPVSLVVTTGPLTIGGVITAHGSGNIHVNTKAGAATVAAAVSTTSGHVTFLASGNIGLNANLTSGSTGTLNVVSSAGSITQADASVASTGSGDIRFRAQGSITVAALSTTGKTALTAITGAIIDGGETNVDVVASSLRIEAGTSVAASGNHLETTIDTFSAWANDGGIFVTETNGFTATDASATVRVVLADATAPSTVTEALQSDIVTTAANGPIVLVSTTGDITLNDGTSNPDGTAVRAHGTGSVLIDALAGSLTANADVRSGSGHITLKGRVNIDLTANVDVVTSGTASLDAETGALTMAGTANVNATSARLRAQGNITVGNVTATNVSIDSDTASIINAAGSTKNVTATNLRLQAQGSIGTSARHLTTNIDIVSALASTGSIYVTEDNGATVQNVTVTVTDFNSDATTTVVTDAAQSDLTTGLNGNIVLVATLGDITLNDGTANNTGTAVTANGTGNILIDSLAGSLTANADILSGTGHITLKGRVNLDLTANVDVTTASTGTASLDAETGALTMAGTANVTASASSARLRAQGNITVGNVTATNVSIDSDTASIINAAGSTKNVTATNLRLQAQGSIGTSARHLTTNIDIVTALASTGSIYVTEDNGATVDTVSVTVTDFNSDATTTVVTDAAQSDLTTSLNGNIVLVATLGDITLNDGLINDTAVSANGTGSILIDSLAGSLTANADILSGTGHITLKADDNISLTEDVDVATAATGTVSLDAETGALTMHGTADILASASSARLRAQGNITVGNVTATNVSIDSDTASIINAAGSTKNVTATNLRLQAQGSIGTSARHLTTNIDIVSALASTGSIYVTEDNGATIQNVTVTVTDFNSDATTTVVTDAAQSDLTTGLNGNIVLVATLGDITLNDGTANNTGTAVTAHGTGNILIDSLAGSLTANADILSGTGHITLKGRVNLDLTANVDVTTASTGTASLDAETGALTMAGTANVTATASSARLRAQGNITVGNVTATNVSIDSDTASIINAAGSTKNVTATNLRLQAQGSIGTSARHLTTNIDIVSALASTGSIYVTEDNGATVQNVTVTVTDFNSDATTTVVTDAAQSDLTTGLNGNIVLVATLGDITLNDGTANNTGTAVTANGTGNILIDSLAGSLTANADILSGTGHITLKGRVNLDLTANVDVTTASTGTASLDAETGALTMAGTANVTATASSARLRAQGNITVGNVTATNVSIDSDTASIINAAGSTKNVTATNLRLQAQGSIGTSARHLTTNIDIVSALASTGSIYVTEDNGATVQNVTVTVTDFNSDATTTVVTDAAQSDLTTGLNGNIVLVATLGDITLNDGTANNTGTAVTANGTGNILIDSLAGSLTANADILSGTGHITLKGRVNLDLTANVDVTTASTGTASLDAETGALTMAGTANVTASASSARLRAQGNITVGNVTATNVSIDSDTASIINAAGSTKNVTATNLRLQAQGSIGTSARHLTTNIDIVSALASTGSIYVTEDNGATIQNVTVTVTDFNSDATTTVVTDAAQSDLTTGLNGNIVLVATLGDITLNDGTANNTGTAVTANGTGNILIDSLAGSLTANADILSGTGHITLKGRVNLDLTANVDVTTASTGTASLDAETGALTMAGTANVTATASSARLRAQGNITVGNVTATNVSIDSDTASIINAAGSTKNVTATNLRLQAQGSIGTSARHLTTNIDIVSALASTGSIYLTEDNGATVQNVTVTVTDFNSDATTTVVTDAAQSDLTTGLNGNIVLVATLGDITLNDGTANNTGTAVTANGTGNILIDSLAGSLTANADILSGTGHITLQAANTISLTANVDVSTASTGTQDIRATTGSLLMAATASLNSVNGDIRITVGNDVLDQVVIGDITATNANVSVFTTGSVLDADTADSSDLDIAANGLRIDAGKGVGLLAGNSLSAATNAIETSVTTLSVIAHGSDGINIRESDVVAINDVISATDTTKSVAVDTVNPDATVTRHTEATQSDLVTTNTNGANGSIVLRTLAGTITLNEGTATLDLNTDAAVVAHGSGNILIQAIGTGTDVIANINADVESSTGNITLKAARTINLASRTDITTSGAGTEDLEASTGSLIMGTSATLNTVGGDIRITVGDDALDQVVIGDITASAANVSIETTGSILDADLGGDSDIDVTALGLRLDAGKGIGLLSGNSLAATTNAIETTIDTLSAIARGSDGIHIVETNALAINDVVSPADTTKSVAVDTVNTDATVTRNTEVTQSDLVTTATNGANGSIVLRTLGGTITLNEGTAFADLDTDASVVAHGAGNILIQAIGAGTDIVVLSNADIHSSTGHITLKAARHLNFGASVDVSTASAGTVSLDAQTGALTMDGTANAVATGSSARLRAQGDITVGNIIAANVSIDSDTAAIINAAGSTKNVTATNLRLQAQTSIGTALRHLTTNLDNVTALASTGSIYVTEDNAATVQNVTVTVQDVTADSTVSAVTDVAQSDLTTGLNGNIVLVTTLGDITLNDGTAPAGGNAVLAHGTGSVRLEALAGSITANADVRSTTGHLTLRAAQNITLNTNVDLVTGTPGTVSLDAVAGALTMHGSATAVATGSSLRLRAQGDITVGNLTATNVSLDSDAASIFNALGSTKNVTATNLRLQAKGQVAAYHRHLTTTVDTLTALVETGAIFVTEDNGVTVGDVAVTITNFNGDATTTSVTDATQSDLRSSGANGDIVLLATLGNITLNDGTAPTDGNAIVTTTAGNITLVANAGSIIANADLRTSTGYITLRAAQNIALNTNVDLVTASLGTASLNAVAGTLTMHGTATVVASGSSLRLRAQGDITVGNLTATNVSIDSDAGSIINAALSTKNVTATNLRLQAQNSIGAPTRHLTTNIDNVSALAATGSIHVTEDNAATVGTVTVTVTNINPDPTFIAVTDAAQSDLTTGQNGDIVLIATLGDLTLTDGTAPAGGNAVLAHGSGSVRLEALAGSITANADIRSSFGHLTLRAAQNITLNANVDVATAALGTASLDAVAGVLTMAGTATVVATGSSVRLRAQGDVIVGNITADNVSLDSDAGALVNAAGSTKNVTATRLRLQAQNSIGVPTRHLTTNLDLLSARSATGSIYVTEDNGLTIDGVTVTVLNLGADSIPVAQLDDLQSDVTTGLNGNIVLVVTTGNLTVNDASAPADGNAIVAHGTGSVRLEAVTGSIAANADVRSTTGHLALLAGSGITLATGVDIVTAAPGTVSLNAGTGTLTMDGTATVLATGSSARLRAQGNVTLGKVTAADVSLDSDAANIYRAALSGQNVVATNLRLQAQQSVGRPNDHLALEVGTITGLATTGGIFVTEKDGLTVSNVAVSVTQLNADATTTLVTDAAQSDLVSGVFGHLVLVSTAGDIVLEDGSDADGNALTAGGAGNVLLHAPAGNLVVRTGADILAGTGNITLKAGLAMTFAAGADVTTGGSGHLYAQAAGGSLTQHDDGRFTAANGNVQLWGRDDVTLGGVTTNASASLIAGTGSVIDAGDATGGPDVIASALRVAAAVGFGSVAAPVESTVATLAARAGSGGFHLRETDSLVLGAVDVGIQQVASDGELTSAFFALGTTGVQTTGGNGPVDIRATAGSITVTNDSSAHGSGSVNLVAGGASGDIVLGAVLSSTTGPLTLTAAGRIRETTTTETPVLVTGGVLTLAAVSGIGETGRGDLDVSAPSLSFNNSGAGQVYLKSHRAGANLTAATLGGAGSLVFTQVTGGLSVSGPVNVADGSATFRVAGSLSLSGAPITAANDISIRALSIVTASSDFSTGTGGTITLVATTDITLDPATSVSASDVTIAAGGNIALAQVDATGLLDITAGGSVTTVDPASSLAGAQFRLATGGDAGTPAAPLRVASAAADVSAGGLLNIVYLNGLNVGRGGMQFDTDAGETQTITVVGTTIGTIGGTIVDNGSGTLSFTSANDITLVAPVVSAGGNITIDARSLADGTADENALLTANNGLITLTTTTGTGVAGAGDIDLSAARLTASTQTGDLQFDSLQSISVVGTGLQIGGIAAAGTIGLNVRTGNLTSSAPMINAGSGGITLFVPNGAFTMTNVSPVSTNVGAITISTLGLMTIGRLQSTTGLISLTTLNSITTVQQLNYANITSLTRPVVDLVQSINILIDSNSVLAIAPNFAGGVEIVRGGSDDIDMSIYSSILTGND